MNEGARALAAKKLSLSKAVDALAAVNCKVSRPGVAKWLAGKSVPSDAARKALEAALGIPCKAWDLAPGGAAAPAPARAPAPPPTAPTQADLVQTAAEKAQDLLTRIERWRGEAEFEGTSAAARAQLATLELKAIEQLARLTGQSAPPESTLLKSPHWTRLCSELLTVLEGHPDALRDVVRLLEGKAAA